MKLALACSVCTLALPLSSMPPLRGAAHSAADALRFAPPQGLALRKVHAIEMRAGLESVRFVLMGEEEDLELDPSDLFRMEQTLALAFTDTYERIEEGDVRELVRRFEELKQTSSETEEGETTQDASASALEGRSVRFRWSEEEQEHEPSWVGEPGESSLLEELELDCDGTGLLPAGAVEPGDAWEIEADALELLLGPSGELHLDPDADEEDELDRRLMDELDGSVRGTYRGLREEDGRKLAVIFLEAKLSAEVEGEATAAEEGEEDEDGWKVGPMRQTSKLQLECSGEVLWDAAAGHMASFELAGDLTLENRVTQQVELPGGAAGDMVQIAVMRGDFEHRADYDAAE